MKEESKIKKINSEIVINSEAEKALFDLSHNLSPIHKKLPSQSMISACFLNEFDQSRTSIPTPTFAEAPVKANAITISNNLFNAIQCKNKDHSMKYLSLNSNNISVICKKCQNEGNKCDNLEIFNETNDELIEDLKYHCNTSQCAGNPCLICIDCNSVFICHNCLLTYHINHKTSSIVYTANEYKDDVNLMYDQLKVMIEEMEILYNQSHANKDKNNHIKKIKPKEANEEQLKKLVTLIEICNSKIIKAIHDTNDTAYQEFITAFHSNDKEANDINIIVSKIRAQCSELSDSLNNLLEEMNADKSKKSNISKCESKQKSSDIITKAQTLIKNSNNTLNRLTQLIYNTKKNKEITLLEQENILKKSNTFEDSVIFSIKSGSNNNAIHLNRFKSYIHNSMVYFKSSSLLIKPRSSFHLTGINLCAVYIHSQRLKNPNNEVHKMENRDSIDIKVTIIKSKSKIQVKERSVIILNDQRKLYGAVNKNDPVISINLSMGILMERDEEYIITVENLNTVNFYGDFWIGSAPTSTHISREQSLICNSTGIEFAFAAPEGIQSDFDEFSRGIIEGIIYTSD